MTDDPADSGRQLPVVRVSRGALTRDFLIFELKLLLDGLVDVIMAPLGALAFVSELLFPGRRFGHRFYEVLRMGERWDRWLSLYQPSQEAELSEEGLIGASSVGADSLIGKIEEMIRQGRLPESAREILDKVPNRRLGQDREPGENPRSDEGEG